jgi:hypothetical protein
MIRLDSCWSMCFNEMTHLVARRLALQFRHPAVVALPTNMTLANAVENVLPPINNLFAHAVGDAPRQVVIPVAFPQTYTGGAGDRGGGNRRPSVKIFTISQIFTCTSMQVMISFACA